MDGALAWFRSYLSNRRQCVKYGGFQSRRGFIDVGVPQGSILEPVLFSIFVNDLPAVVEHSSVNMYADDTELHCSGDKIQHVQNDLQSGLFRVQGWLQANRQLNVTKSVIIVLGSWQKLRNCCASLA